MPATVSSATNAESPVAAAASALANASVPNASPAQVATGGTLAATIPSSSSLPRDKIGLLKGILEANDVDIVFYGRLEDQFGNALGNVPINFEIRYENVSGKGVQRGQVASDAYGSFTISGYKGERLSFIPEKQGYVLTSHNNGGVYSPQWPEEQRVHPDPNNQVVIKLWKLKGGEHLIHFQTGIHVPLDGTMTAFDLQTGRQVESGGDFILSVKSSAKPNIRQEYDWQVTIQAVDGGLISSSDDFEQMFLAPDFGYEPKLDINYQKDTRSWTSRFIGSFYFTSRNGNCYGKFGVEVLTDATKNDTVPVILNSYVNPTASRNLEIDPAKVTEAHP